MIFRINPTGDSHDPRYSNYPAYFIEILEEINDTGTYKSIGKFYIDEDNFLNVLLDVATHERDVDRFRKREPQFPRLLEKIRIRRLHEILEDR